MKLTIKKLIFISVLLLLAIVTYSDSKITRGPSVGEIYFIGPTCTGLGLFYSTDFGQTVICADSSFSTNIMSVTADKTAGVVYYATLTEALYISYDYGNIGSWEFRNGGVKIQINSGLTEGEIYSSFSKHSEDYGVNFINHSYNGFFGSKIDVEIDIEANVGYVLVNKYGVPDSLFLLISYDNFENLSLHNSFNVFNNPIGQIRRGVEFGELFTIYFLIENNIGYIKYSFDYGLNWLLMNDINVSNYFIKSFTGSRQNGELFLYLSFVTMGWENAHSYIYHSLDYGKTFEVFHPFAKGNEPVLANFSSDTTEGEMPFTVDFCNFSIGDIQQYEWDFNNDGIVDSYEETPVWTYQDTGYYSVGLTITGTDSSNTFLKENYIQVVKTTGITEKEKHKISCYPNPFSDFITITFPQESTTNPYYLEIYDISGNRIRTIITDKNEIIWQGKNENGKKCSQGIYFVKLNNFDFIKKILLTH
jgi:PKD repeat protein